LSHENVNVWLGSVTSEQVNVNWNNVAKCPRKLTSDLHNRRFTEQKPCLQNVVADLMPADFVLHIIHQ